MDVFDPGNLATRQPRKKGGRGRGKKEKKKIKEIENDRKTIETIETIENDRKIGKDQPTSWSANSKTVLSENLRLQKLNKSSRLGPRRSRTMAL